MNFLFVSHSCTVLNTCSVFFFSFIHLLLFVFEEINYKIMKHAILLNSLLTCTEMPPEYISRSVLVTSGYFIILESNYNEITTSHEHISKNIFTHTVVLRIMCNKIYQHSCVCVRVNKFLKGNLYLTTIK